MRYVKKKIKELTELRGQEMKKIVSLDIQTLFFINTFKKTFRCETRGFFLSLPLQKITKRK
jgi:hypothetical protein